MPGRLHPVISDSLLLAAWLRLRHMWRPMAAWTLLLWAFVVLALVPLSSAFIGWQLRSSQRLVVGNEELMGWLLTPAGLGYLLVAGSVAVMNWVLRYAGLYQLITDAFDGRRPSLATAALQLALKLPTLVRFSLHAVALALLAAAPVVAGAWLIYRFFLGEHDINYYMAIKPPAWYQALALLGAWLLLAAGALVYLGGRFMLALPSWLDGYRGFSAALRRSWQLTRARSGRLLRLLAVVAAGWVGVGLLFEATLLAVASRTTEWVSTLSPVLWPTVACAGAFLAGSVLLNVTTEFLGFSFLSVVLTKFYFEDTPLHRAAPPARVAAEPTVREIQAVRHWLSPRRLVLVVALLLTISILVGRRFLDNLPEMRPIVVMAHRGGPPPSPENTLAALERAIAARADFSEIDVLRTRDGVVVVTHDADLMRVARDPRRIADTNYAELSRVVKLPDDGSPPEERRLATLGDFLERARGRIKLNIELKYYGWDPHLVEAVIREVRTRQMEPHVVLMSLNLEAVHQARRLAPDLRVGYVSSLTVGSISLLPVDFVAVSHRRLTPQLIRDAHQHGLQVHAWTVNTVPAMTELIERGIDGLVTDDPARAVRVRDELANLGPLERVLLHFRKLLLDDTPDSPPNPAGEGR